MYSGVKACVKSVSGITPFYPTNIGVRQGCVLETIVFFFFMYHQKRM